MASPNQVDREAWNHLRMDLYRRLIPKIRENDQHAGAYGFTMHWNDPSAKWNDGNVQHAWNAIGIDPIIQELFYVIEQMEGEDIAALETLDALTDPFSCPEPYLPDLAASFGYRLAEGLTEERKRVIVQGIIQAYKARGRFVGFKTFYRMLGFEVIRIFPLWKKNINEASGDYSRVQFTGTTIAAAPVGPAGIQVYAARFADAPIIPGTVTFTDGTHVIGDDGHGNLLGAGGQTGTINYETGDYRIDFKAPTPGAVTASYQQVTEEWPFHAARMDIEIALSPFGLSDPPLVDQAFTEGILGRLDEVRPVHVLLRTLAFVIEFADSFGPEGATDRVACTTVRKDIRDGLPGQPGSNRTYILDEGLHGEDELVIEWVDVAGSGQPVRTMPFDDLAPIVCPLDRLGILGDYQTPATAYPFNATAPFTPINPHTVRITDFGGQVFTDDGQGDMIQIVMGLPVIRGSVNYTTGAIVLTSGNAPLAIGGPVTVAAGAWY